MSSFHHDTDEIRAPTSPISPVARFSTVPGGPSRAPEFYGFVAWISTSIAFVLYCLWALLPDQYITYCGITWYPNREWAILLPAYSVVLVLLTYTVYFALALSKTPSFSDLVSMHDGHFTPPAHTAHAAALSDMPLGEVNRRCFTRQNSQVRSSVRHARGFLQ